MKLRDSLNPLSNVLLRWMTAEYSTYSLHIELLSLQYFACQGRSLSMRGVKHLLLIREQSLSTSPLPFYQFFTASVVVGVSSVYMTWMKAFHEPFVMFGNGLSTWLSTLKCTVFEISLLSWWNVYILVPNKSQLMFSNRVRALWFAFSLLTNDDGCSLMEAGFCVVRHAEIKYVAYCMFIR